MDLFKIEYVQKDIVVIVLLTATRQNIYFISLYYSIDG